MKDKSEILGENPGTASSKLKKQIMFYLVQKLNLDLCFQCGQTIELIEEFSIEHKIPWKNSETPQELFYDINNIAFSHLKCNIAAANKSTPRKKMSEEERKEKRRSYSEKYRRENRNKVQNYEFTYNRRSEVMQRQRERYVPLAQRKSV